MFKKCKANCQANDNLYLRGNVFYYMVALPRQDGKRRYFIKSLHTKDYYEALEKAKNTAETAINSIDKALKEHGDKVSSADREAIENAKKELADELAKSDATAESLKTKTDALTEKAMKLGEAVYKAQQEAQNTANTGTESSSENKSDGARDADFSEK